MPHVLCLELTLAVPGEPVVKGGRKSGLCTIMSVPHLPTLGDQQLNRIDQAFFAAWSKQYLRCPCMPSQTFLKWAGTPKTTLEVCGCRTSFEPAHMRCCKNILIVAMPWLDLKCRPPSLHAVQSFTRSHWMCERRNSSMIVKL